MNGGGELLKKHIFALEPLLHGMNGGVWINVGCAVVLPETYLKAVSVAINLGEDLSAMTTGQADVVIGDNLAEALVVRESSNA